MLNNSALCWTREKLLVILLKELLHTHNTKNRLGLDNLFVFFPSCTALTLRLQLHNGCQNYT
jgi:hypothetical protein